MTVRELRKILTEVENQQMTIRELRKVLFDVNNQDVELAPMDLMKFTSDK